MATLVSQQPEEGKSCGETHTLVEQYATQVLDFSSQYGAGMLNSGSKSVDFVQLKLQFFTSVIWRNFDAKRDLQKISRRELPPRCFGKKVFIPDQPLKSAKS